MNILLHICCGICAAGAVEQLVAEGHRVTGLFYNPNIHPADEYYRRLEVARAVAQKLDFPLEEEPYNTEEWFALTGSLKDEPEGGKRCEVCFRLRLTRTYQLMLKHGLDKFTTTLTISPHKSAEAVNRIGGEIGKDSYLARDFKKHDGFRRASELARGWDLYRQKYCGCIYSVKETPEV